MCFVRAELSMSKKTVVSPMLLFLLSVFPVSMKEAVLRFSIWRPPYVYAPTSILGWQCRQEGVGMESGPAIPCLARD